MKDIIDLTSEGEGNRSTTPSIISGDGIASDPEFVSEDDAHFDDGENTHYVSSNNNDNLSSCNNMNDNHYKNNCNLDGCNNINYSNDNNLDDIDDIEEVDSSQYCSNNRHIPESSNKISSFIDYSVFILGNTNKSIASKLSFKRQAPLESTRSTKTKSKRKVIELDHDNCTYLSSPQQTTNGHWTVVGGRRAYVSSDGRLLYGRSAYQTAIKDGWQPKKKKKK